MDHGDGTLEPIPLARPDLGEAELEAVRRVFASGWAAGQGPANRAFAARIARETGIPHVLPCANCTAALHLALIVHDIGPGDEVVVSDYAFPAAGHAVLHVGARPVFADVDPQTGAATPETVRARLTDRTRAVIVVHPFGVLADIRAIREVLGGRNIVLIEDAACAYGASDENLARPGEVSDAVCYSFHARKNATCGEGGALCLHDETRAARAASLVFFGIRSALERRDDGLFAPPVFTDPGYNYKLSDIQAAIADVQLARLPDLLAARREAAARYRELLAPVEGLRPPVTPPGAAPSWQSYVVTLDDDLNRDRVIRRMREEGVECQIGTYAAHMQPVYGPTDPCPVSARLFRTHLALPLFPGVTEAQQRRVAATLARVIAEQRRRNSP